MNHLLQVHSATIQFGGVKALQEVSFHLDQEDLLGLIGPNGAGKTTLMRFIGNESEININTKHPEFLDWKWINLDDLTKIAVNFKLDVYKNVKHEVKKILN